MIKTLRNAWHVPELKKKILYTLLMLLIFRLGSAIPVPGLTQNALAAMVGAGGLGELLDTFSGGAFSQASIFAMSITPYVTSSIIMQLLTVAIPALERLAKEGEEGRKKLAQWTRYGTVILAFIQAAGLYAGLVNTKISETTPAIPNPNWMTFVVITLTFTAGTAFLMWLGEQITEKGVGNGISLIIFAGIVSRAPVLLNTLYNTYLHGGNFTDVSFGDIVAIIAALVIGILIIGFVVFFNDSERRIPVQYAKRMVGRKMYGGQSTHIPIKVTMAGVIPIIFASSMLTFPQTLGMIFDSRQQNDVWKFITHIFSSSSIVYAILFFLLIIFFTYFYTAMQFNPVEIANNMKQNGGFVLGIRPGKPTSDYIAKVLTRITFAGSIFLATIAVFPIILGSAAGMNLGFGGTSILIAVGVALETVKQMESQMLTRHYKGFLE